MSINDAVTVSITRATKVPSQAGFGVPLLLAHHSATPNLIDEIGSAEEALDLGFSETSRVYNVALAVFSQTPRPPTMLIGKRQTYTQILHFTPVDTTAGFIYSWTVVETDGTETEISVEVQPGDAVADIVDDFVTAMAGIGDVTTTDGTTHAILTSDAGKCVQYKALPKPHKMKVFDATVAGTIVTDYNAVYTDGAARFYEVLVDRTSKAEALALAAVIESQKKSCLLDTSDSECVDPSDTDDLFSSLKALNYANTTAIYLANATGNAAARWAGKMLPETPGSETWAHKTLVGCVSDDLRSGEQNAIEAKNGNYYAQLHGVDVTFPGNVPDGDYVDTIRGVHWTDARAKEAVFGVYIANKKVAFTDQGIASIQNVVVGVLNRGVRNGLYAASPAPEVLVPAASEVEAADKAARRLPDVTFKARLAGAIHKTDITGTVSL